MCYRFDISVSNYPTNSFWQFARLRAATAIRTLHFLYGADTQVQVEQHVATVVIEARSLIDDEGPMLAPER